MGILGRWDSFAREARATKALTQQGPSAERSPVGVARHAAEARRCRFRDSYFIAAPLHFFHAIEAWPCERQAQWRVEYCQDCIEPPYVKTQDLEPR